MIDLECSVKRKIKQANTDWWINEKAVVGDNGKTYIGYVNDVGDINLKEKMSSFSLRCTVIPALLQITQ